VLCDQLVLSFFETRSKKAWFRKVEEKICFEQWVFFIILKEDSPVETPGTPTTTEQPNTKQPTTNPTTRPTSRAQLTQVSWPSGGVAEAREKLENELRERIMHIIQTVNEKQNHIPLKFQPPDLIPFPYEVRGTRSFHSTSPAMQLTDVVHHPPPTTTDHNTIDIRELGRGHDVEPHQEPPAHPHMSTRRLPHLLPLFLSALIFLSAPGGNELLLVPHHPHSPAHAGGL
jgi:hypothetical protein